MVTLPKTCEEIDHTRLPVQDRNGATYCYNCIIEAFQTKDSGNQRLDAIDDRHWRGGGFASGQRRNLFYTN